MLPIIGPIALVLGLAPDPRAAAAPPPNVLVLMADDLGAERVVAYGDLGFPHGPTPVLDALAAAGVLFRNAYANPVCSPTRTTCLTGRYAFRTGIGESIDLDERGSLQPAASELTLPERVGRTHHTVAVGKWHLAVSEAQGGDGFLHPVRFGFDQHVGSILGELPDYYSFEKTIATAQGHQQVPVRRYATTDEVDDALLRIERLGDEPWFLWLAFHAPHAPFHVPPAELVTLQVSETSPVPRKHRAMVEAMDTEIGRLLGSIRPEVLARTWVIFVGDNGTPTAALAAAVNSKTTVYELGVHVPLIVAGPGVVQPGREVSALVNTTDLYATILDLVGQPPVAAATDSVSFHPQLVDPTAPPARDWVYVSLHRPNGPGPYLKHRRAIRGERYKLIRQMPADPGSAPVELFDLWADPGEQENLVPHLTPEQQTAFDVLDATMQQLEGS